MARPIIDEEECSGCDSCVDACPNDVLEVVDEVAKAVDINSCDGCGACSDECPMECVTIEEE